MVNLTFSIFPSIVLLPVHLQRSLSAIKDARKKQLSQIVTISQVTTITGFVCTETPANNTDGGEDDNITMMKVIMMMIIMMNTATITNYAPIMAMAIKRKTKMRGIVNTIMVTTLTKMMMITMARHDFYCKGFPGSQK